MARTALITGASSGLGAEYARQLAIRGFDLVLVARDREALDERAVELRDRFRADVEVLAVDLLKPRQRAKVEARLAGPGPPDRLLSTTPASVCRSRSSATTSRMKRAISRCTSRCRCA